MLYSSLFQYFFQFSYVPTLDETSSIYTCSVVVWVYLLYLCMCMCVCLMCTHVSACEMYKCVLLNLMWCGIHIAILQQVLFMLIKIFIYPREEIMQL